MADRAIWKGNIHFGTVDVPVKLHTAVREERIQFHLLHRRDHVKLRQQLICAYEQVPVPVEEQVRGFALTEGRYLLIDPTELTQAEPAASRAIEIHEFVPTAQIDPLFIERVYHLEPELPVKGYHALAGALGEMDLAGICTWTMRKRSYLGALQIRGATLRLATLRYADELVAVGSLDLPELPLTERELQIGSDLIAQLTAPFAPQKFVNEHQQRLQQLIDRKARGEKVALLRPRRLKPTPADGLLLALEASLRKVA